MPRAWPQCSRLSRTCSGHGGHCVAWNSWTGTRAGGTTFCLDGTLRKLRVFHHDLRMYWHLDKFGAWLAEGKRRDSGVARREGLRCRDDTVDMLRKHMQELESA